MEAGCRRVLMSSRPKPSGGNGNQPVDVATATEVKIDLGAAYVAAEITDEQGGPIPVRRISAAMTLTRFFPTEIIWCGTWFTPRPHPSGLSENMM